MRLNKYLGLKYGSSKDKASGGGKYQRYETLEDLQNAHPEVG